MPSCPADAGSIAAPVFPGLAGRSLDHNYRGDRAPGCVYLIAPGTVTKKPIWRAPAARRMRGPVWAPNGRSFAAAQKVRGAFYVYRVDLSGRILNRYLGRDFAFLLDGRLVLLRGQRLLIELREGSARTLASVRDLERVAGFRPDYYGGLRLTQGYGRDGIVVELSRGKQYGPDDNLDVLLLVPARGAVRRITPVFSRYERMPGPASWSPDGRILLIPWEGRFQRYYHIHCLSVWSHAEGYREAFCKNPHFDMIQ